MPDPISPETSARFAQQSRGLFLLAYLGYLTHIVLETLMLHFSREAIDEETWQSYVEYWSQPSAEWTAAGFALLTLLPIGSAILSGGRKAWTATAVFGVAATLLHAAHYAGELAEAFGAVGALGLLFHVAPSAWASWLAWRCARAFRP